MHKSYLFANLAALLLVSSPAWPQAIVNESLETQSLYVDVVKGSDTNPGTQSQPLKTIGAAGAIAFSNKAAGLGTKVIINPGIYREALNFSSKPNYSSLPITFQASAKGVVVSGAVAFTGWSAYNSNIYKTAWPNRWGFCPVDQGNAPFEQQIVLRREMLFVNGAPMTEVLSLTQMVYPGSFFVDETAGLVYVWPPAGTNMTSADVEVASNSPILQVQAPSGPIDGLVFRGLTFEYASSCHSESAVTVTGNVTNVIFDHDNFNWNGGSGLSLSKPVANATVENCVANHNGGTGYATYRTKHLLLQNDEGSYNNWRGAQGAYYEWGTGGAHLFSDHDETITGFTAKYNQTHSIHWDTDNQNITVSSLLSSQNMIGPLFEKNEGPITITGSQFCTSQTTASGYGGFAVRDSEFVTLTGNTFYNNNVGQVFITGLVGGYQVTNWETGQVYNLINQNLTLTQNVIEGGPGQLVFKDGFLNGSEWTSFVTTLVSDNNTWWNASNATDFTVPYPASGTTLDFPGWQSTTSQDVHSTWSAPSSDPSTACAVTADAPDYWFYADNGVVTANNSGNAVYNLTTNALGGMTGTVTLTADLSSIPGATVTFSPSTLTLPGTSVMTFNAGVSTPAGTYNFMVLANTGSVTRNIVLQVVVPLITVRLSAASLTFTSPVGGSSPSQAVTLTNTGSTTLQMTSITLPQAFSQTNTCGTAVAAGQNCTITVTFSPKKLQTYTGSVTIKDSDPSSPQLIALTGTATGAPAASFSPRDLHFGNEVYLKPSAAMVTTLTNSGSATLNITSIGFSGANAGDYSQTNTCGTVLLQGASCAINVIFTPKSTGSRTANVSVTDDAPGSPQTVSLTGSGITAISVSPKSLSYGSIKVGNSQSKTVTITNSSTAAINVTSLTLSGANADNFAKTSTCGKKIAGSGSCTVTVTFTPKSTGSKSATLTIKDSDPSSPQTVSITGSGK